LANANQKLIKMAEEANKNRKLTPQKVNWSKQNFACFAPDFSDKFAFLLKDKSRGFFGLTLEIQNGANGFQWSPFSFPGERVLKA